MIINRYGFAAIPTAAQREALMVGIANGTITPTVPVPGTTASGVMTVDLKQPIMPDIFEPGSSYLPDILTDGSGNMDPTRIAIFGLGAVGLIAGIFMLKTKRG